MLGMIDAKQSGRLAAGQAAHDFFGVREGSGQHVRMKIGRKKLLRSADANVQVLLSFAHLCLDSWARFLYDRRVYLSETIAPKLSQIRASSF